ncbi:MAG: tRNA nucleotidyltransferase [Oscillospiraceae bacterium]|jgi:tRNA nucleotidyltransferase (CCA-adding enzyme)|nr:tRNA nucleotidyltransferase [Oscillospiraceae bacterium]
MPVIELNFQANTVLCLLEEAGFPAYLVGGCVRDALLGEAPQDWDIATGATPEQVTQACKTYRVIGTGLRHGTVTVLVGHCPVEVTTFRLDGVYADHRRPQSVAFTKDLTADLARRDFTVNAMAYAPQTGIIDPFGGAADLAAGLLRCVGEPALRFSEDALRILRCLRFAGTLGFAIEATTAAKVWELHESLRYVSVERIAAEWRKLLCGRAAKKILLEYREVFFFLMPQLRAAYTPERWENACAALARLEAQPVLRMAALLQGLENSDAKALLNDLRQSKKEITHVLQLLDHARRFSSGDAHGTRAQLARMLGEIGLERSREVLALRGAPSSLFAQLLACAGQGVCTSLAQLAVDGDDLTRLGLCGPAVGATLRRLLEEVLEGVTPNEKEALLERV